MHTAQILSYCTFAGAALYIYYLFLAYKGLHIKEYPLRYPRKFVSIVIAARNEEDNLPELLLRLRNQTYPTSEYEVILMNDDSTDKTKEIAEKYASKWQGLKVIDVVKVGDVISRKKHALQQGIEAAAGEIILLTDADCLPGTNWVSSMTAAFDNNTDMVAGFSRTEGKKFYPPSAQWFEHFDFIAMFAVAAGLIRKGKYFSCSGQNLAYKKESWKKVDGFHKISHIISGDDVNLMQLFRQEKMNIKFNLNRSSFVTTGRIKNWAALLNQRSRWASNTWFQIKLNPEFFLYLLSVLVITFMPWVLVFYAVRSVLIIIAIRCLAEIAFLSYAYKIFNEPASSLLSYPLWFILQPLYVFAAAFQSLFGFFKWK